MEVFFVLFLLIVIAFLFVHLLKKLKIPEVVSLIILGIFFGYPSINSFILADSIFYIELLGTIGLFALLFLAGLESSWRELKFEECDALYISIFCLLVPFVFGISIMYFVFGFSFLASFIIGLSLSITAESTKARVLFDMGVLRTRVASALMGAGIIDDIFGMVFFTIVLLIVGMFDIKEYFILAGIIMSFIVGLLVQKYAREHHLTKKVETISSIVFIPFFFISTGMNFSIEEISTSSLPLMFSILGIGIGGKLLGVFFSKPFVNFSSQQLYVMGWAMNSRGALDIALAVLAYSTGLLSQGMFSSLLILALVSTVIFPFIVEKYISTTPKIMN